MSNTFAYNNNATKTKLCPKENYLCPQIVDMTPKENCLCPQIIFSNEQNFSFFYPFYNFNLKRIVSNN